MDDIGDDVEVGDVPDASSTTTIRRCCGTSVAAPTPSSCVLSVATPSSTRVPIDYGERGEAPVAERKTTATTNTIAPLPPPSASAAVTTAPTTPTKIPTVPKTPTTATHSIPLPWDFTATELCRSCGKPQTELYELFEHISDDNDANDANDEVINDKNGNNDCSGNNNNNNDASMRDPTTAALTAAATSSVRSNADAAAAAGTAATETLANQQHSKMDNILQEMQIWQLGVKYDDGLPQSICAKCTAQFYIISKFRRKCLKVQARLQALYEERRLEEQQLLQQLESKGDLDIPPVFDIGNDLINDNYGQPLSVVELFESSNWNAESTPAETLSSPGDDGDVDELLTDTVTAESTEIHRDRGDAVGELTNTTRIRTPESNADCPDLVLNSNTNLVNSMDIAVKVNIEEESLLDENAAIFETNRVEQLFTEDVPSNSNNADQEPELRVHTRVQEKTPLVLEPTSSRELFSPTQSTPNSTARGHLHAKQSSKESVELFITNQSKVISVSQQTAFKNLTKKSIDAIPSEALDSIALTATITATSREVTPKQPEMITTERLRTGPNDKTEISYEENHDDQEDCILEESREGPTSNIKEEFEHLPAQSNSKVQPTGRNVKSRMSIELNPTFEQQTSTPTLRKNETQFNTLDMFESTKSNTRDQTKEEATKFVSKAALKEYASPPICYDETLRAVQYKKFKGKIRSNLLPFRNKKSLSVCSSGAVNRRNVCQEATNRNSSRHINKSTLAVSKGPLTALYKEKCIKRAAASAGKAAKLLSKQQKPSTRNENSKNNATDLLQLMRECSVRLCRLTASELEGLVLLPHTTPEAEIAAEIKVLNQSPQVKLVATVDDSPHKQEITEQQAEDRGKGKSDDDSGFAASKRPRLSLRAGLRAQKAEMVQWKTKAEMKASDGLLGLRKSTLRRKSTAADIEPRHDTQPTGTRNRTDLVASLNMTEDQNAKKIITDHAEDATVDEHGSLREQHKRTAAKTSTTAAAATTTTIVLTELELEQHTSEKTLQNKSQTKATAHYQTAAGHRIAILRGGRKAKRSRMERRGFRKNLMKLRQHNSSTVVKEIESQLHGRGQKPLAADDDMVEVTQVEPTAPKYEPCICEPAAIDDSQNVAQLKQLNQRQPAYITGTSENAFVDPLEKRTPAAAKGNDALKSPEAITTKCHTQNDNPDDYEILDTRNIAFRTAVENEGADTLTSAPATYKEFETEAELYKTIAESVTPGRQKLDERCEGGLIVRVPLAALTEEFQKLHCNVNAIPLTRSELNSKGSERDISFESAEILTPIPQVSTPKSFCWPCEAEGRKENHSQVNFCESAAAESYSELAGAHSIGSERRLETAEEPKVAATNQNDSDQSDFYGFTNESDVASYDTQAAADTSLLEEKSHTVISSQINDYINDFQTHCLDIDDRSESTTFAQNVESVSQISENQNSMDLLPKVRDGSHLPGNMIDSFVDNTINGLLNEIQDQSIFSPSTTPIVTMESEDFHNHSSYSPLSETSSERTPSTHDDFMKAASGNLGDLTDSGPAVNPTHTIQRINNCTEQPCDTTGSVFANISSHYTDYAAECFAEDSTQSELIGFQNDIPCFENIELNNSTPHLNSAPPSSSSVSETSIPLASSRSTNSALQGSLMPQTKNVEYPFKQSGGGSVQYLGLANQNDLCNTLGTDSMGLVCTTGNGVQMHTPTISNPTEQALSPLDTPSALSDDSKEYAVDSATLHLTQIFTDLPVHQIGDNGPSSSQTFIRAAGSLAMDKSMSYDEVAVAKKSIMPNFSIGNVTNSGPTKCVIYPKRNIPIESCLKIKDNSQYVTLQSNNAGNTTANVQFRSRNAISTQLPAATGQEVLTMRNAKYTLYTEVRPQDLQWQAASSTHDQQTTTTYYINTADLNNSNLISTTTISVSPLISGGGIGAVGSVGSGGGGLALANVAELDQMSNLTLVPSQLTHQTTSAAGMHVVQSQQPNKRTIDANDNYIGGMQNQPIMIVFPQDYIADTPTVSALYNSASNQVTITPIPQTLNTVQSSSAQMKPNSTSITPIPTITTVSTSAATPPTNLQQSQPQKRSVATAKSAAAPPSARNRVQQQQKVNLTCRFCHKRPKFTNNLDYSNHIIATHPAESPYNCPSCPMFFVRRTQRQQHIIEAHSGNRFHCAQCGQTFSAQRTLDMHLQRFHVLSESPVAQLQRPTVQHKKQQQQQRPIVQHKQQQQQQQQQQQMLDVMPSCSQQAQPVQQLQQVQHTDGHGAAGFNSGPTTTWHEKSPGVQQQHMRSEKVRLQVAETEKYNNNTQLTRDVNQIKPAKPPHRILGCPDCDESFDDLANQGPHAHQIPPSSHGCGSVNMPSPEQTEPDSTSTTTLRHFRKQRLSSKSSNDPSERTLRSTHNCSFCVERFSSEASLRKHQQMVHGTQATTLPFVCSICKRGFRMRIALQRHMETHDSVGRPYECNICLVRFPRPSQLTLHKLTVHFLRKPHGCNVCGKQFGTESALKTHEKFHGVHLKTHLPVSLYLEDEASPLQSDCDQKERSQQQLQQQQQHQHIQQEQHHYQQQQDQQQEQRQHYHDPKTTQLLIEFDTTNDVGPEIHISRNSTT